MAVNSLFKTDNTTLDVEKNLYSDLVKESILNILEYSKDSKIDLNNSLVLDLFAGTGSFGLECISRGATKVYFFENYIQSLEILQKNIKKSPF